MPAISNKRARAPVACIEAKKAKVVDPITEKVELLAKTISDPECQLQDSYREMLLQAIPHTLTLPRDERHAYQTQVAQMVEQVLKDYVAHWEQQVSNSKVDVVETAQKAEETLKIVEESAGKIGDQEEEVQRRKGVLDEDSEALKAAEHALKCASKEVAEFDENLKAIIAQRDQCSSIYNESFIALKNGGLDAKEVARLMKEVQPMLKKLSTESSMLSAMTPAFKKSPAERGPFDVMAIEGADGIFTKHLGDMQDQIDKADITKTEKESTEVTSQEALKAATKKRTASEDALQAAEVDLAALEAKHKDLFASCNAAAEASAGSEEVVATKEGRLTQVQSAFNAFKELLERMPEPAADVTMDKLGAVDEPIPMQPVA